MWELQYISGQECNPIRITRNLFHVVMHELSNKNELTLSQISFIMETDGRSFLSGEINEDPRI
jgi:hypothetical protein